MVRFDCDFAWDEPIQEVLLAIRKHKGKILDFDPTGPGGGNPNVLLQFPTEEEAMAFLTERYPDDEEEFSRSRLQLV
jgi:hypothetical protein